MSGAWLRPRAEIAGWAFYARYRELAGFPGWFLLDMVIPLLITALPILLSRSVVPGGSPASPYAFQSAVGTADHAAFLLVGANVFLLTLRAFWDIGLWLENEARTGTLDLLSLAPFDRRWVVAGIALFDLARGLVVFSPQSAVHPLEVRIVFIRPP